MRDSQKFVPPTRTNTRTVQPDAGSSGTPKCRRLYSDPADAIFSSTPELLKTPKPPTPRNNHQTQETGLPMGKPFVRRLQRNQKAKQTTERAVTSPSSNLTQMSPSLLAPKSLKSIERQTANVDNESNQLMTSEAISAVQNHLVQVPDTAPYDCASHTESSPKTQGYQRLREEEGRTLVMVSLFQDFYIVSSQEETRDLSVRCRINATIEKCTVWLLWGCPHAYHIKEKDG